MTQSPVNQASVEESQTPTAAALDGKRDVLMPGYSRELLKIFVPLRVTLASQRKSVADITELGPGSIIKFEKTCDQPLQLTIGEHVIAEGEVVKVGDKFGLRIGNLVRSRPQPANSN